MSMGINIKRWKKKNGEKSNNKGNKSNKDNGKKDLSNGMNTKIPKGEVDMAGMVKTQVMAMVIVM